MGGGTTISVVLSIALNSIAIIGAIAALAALIRLHVLRTSCVLQLLAQLLFIQKFLEVVNLILGALLNQNTLVAKPIEILFQVLQQAGHSRDLELCKKEFTRDAQNIRKVYISMTKGGQIKTIQDTEDSTKKAEGKSKKRRLGRRGEVRRLCDRGVTHVMENGIVTVSVNAIDDGAGVGRDSMCAGNAIWNASDDVEACESVNASANADYHSRTYIKQDSSRND